MLQKQPLSSNPQSPEDSAPNAEQLLLDFLSPSSPHVAALKGDGFCILSSVLTQEECQHAIDLMWDFIEDTSNFTIQRNTNSFQEDNSHWPVEGRFSNHGAGWLLGETRELLASRVFEDQYNTNELHSSKEGFRMIRPGDATSPVLNPQSVPQTGDRLTIRALVAFSDFSSATKTTSNGIYLMNSHLSDGDSNGEIHERSRRISLSAGDVLLYRSDVLADCFADPTSATPVDSSNINLQALFFCTMQPVAWTPDKVRNLKVEAYKQRQTGDYQVHLEEWNAPPSQQGRNTRTYFRASPPHVTRRLAELYGILPYRSNDEDINRAIIRGVRFVGQEDAESASFIRRPCPAETVSLAIEDDPHSSMVGPDKYLGGMPSPCGRYIYGVPGTAQRVLRISATPGVSTMDWIGPSYKGKFKWLRGVEIPPEAMTDHDNYPSGCCIALSCNDLSFLKVNPATDHVYTFGHDVLERECAAVSGWYYHGGNLAENGWIYCIPANAQRVCKLNPSTDEVCMIGPVFEPGGQKWFGGIMGSDQCIYGIPHNAQEVLKIDPTTDEVTLLGGTNEPLPRGNWKWHGGLAAGEKIIGFPNNSDEILVIDCRSSTVYTIRDSTILQSGRHRIPQDGRYKYLGGALTLDGRYAYLFPCDAERVLRIDCHLDELALVGPPLLDGENKFQNGFCGRDGCLYGIPQRAAGVLRVQPGKNGEEDHIDIMPCGEEMMGIKDKYEGGVLGLDGCIYCIPMKATTCIKVVPPEAI